MKLFLLTMPDEGLPMLDPLPRMEHVVIGGVPYYVIPANSLQQPTTASAVPDKRQQPATTSPMVVARRTPAKINLKRSRPDYTANPANEMAKEMISEIVLDAGEGGIAPEDITAKVRQKYPNLHVGQAISALSRRSIIKRTADGMRWCIV